MKIIDTNIIKKNVKLIKKNHEIIAVVKNDAYGLGIIGIGTLLINEGIRHFAVISIEEAILLRDLSSSIEIILLGPIPYQDLDLVKEYDITLSMNSNKDNVSDDIKKIYKINTNLNRFGFDIKDVPSGVLCYSHLAIEDIVVAENFINKTQGHIGSSKLLVGDKVRVGWLLYNEAVSILEPIIFIRQVKENSYVGYDYFTKREMTIGIINIGYYNGLTTANKGRMVYIKGSFYPIISIAMNQTFIEIDENIVENDMVEIVGKHISFSDVALYLSTTPYEVLVGFRNMMKKYI